MAEPKLCPDCGREACCGQATVPDAATLDCHGGAQCLRLAYAREKAAREKAEQERDSLRREKLIWDEYDVKDRAKTREINILTKEVRELSARAAKLEGLLRKLEWTRLSFSKAKGTWGATCPICQGASPRHAAGCEVRAALPPEAGGHSPKEPGSAPRDGEAIKKAEAP